MSTCTISYIVWLNYLEIDYYLFSIVHGVLCNLYRAGKNMLLVSQEVVHLWTGNGKILKYENDSS